MPQPIACSLTPEQLRCAADELLPGLGRRADRIDLAPDCARLTFAAAPGLLADIGKVLDRERQCCPFLEFTLEAPSGHAPIHLTISGPDGTSAFLASLDSAFAPPAR